MLHLRPLSLASFSLYVVLVIFTFGVSTRTKSCVDAFNIITVVPTIGRRQPKYGCFNRAHTSPTAIRLSSNDDDPRDNSGRSIRSLQSSALKESIDVGDTVVCKRSLPNQGINENASYEVTSIYTQYFDDETQQIVKQQLDSLDEYDNSQNNQVYMTLYSPQYQSEPVVVTPQEVGLVSVREELGNAAWLAVPGFFWIFVAASFYNTYHERTGGSFGDALFGR